MSDSNPHIPILVEAVLDSLNASIKSDALYIDGTIGAGGHSRAILSARDDSRLLGLDRDPQAVQLAMARLVAFRDRATLIHDTYLNMAVHAGEWLGNESPLVDGILLDLGLSSMQLDQPERGFAFRYNAPLDMRFDSTGDGPTAADLVNTLPADALADILYEYGEERHSRRIAHAIVDARPVTTTTQLAEIVADAYRGPRQKIHPATRTFQALRIAVNSELDAVTEVLPIAIDLLKPGGRLAVITFHSLEDRIVKHTFRDAATDCICPPRQPVCTCDHRATIKLVNRKLITASEAEKNKNPRARSAKMRVVERLGTKP
jgi:16S rRNA (cytosine1402-N4)-methyltransferase